MATATAFQEWLERKAREVNQPERLRRRDEWIAALHRFRDQIEEWIRESDPEGLLIIERMEIDRTEPNLGTYTAPALKISLGDEAVRILPMGRDARALYRNADGSEQRYEGRIDLTSGSNKYILYGIANEEPRKWVVAEHDPGPPTPFDRDRFEKMLQELLS